MSSFFFSPSEHESNDWDEWEDLFASPSHSPASSSPQELPSSLPEEEEKETATFSYNSVAWPELPSTPFLQVHPDSGTFQIDLSAAPPESQFLQILYDSYPVLLPWKQVQQNPQFPIWEARIALRFLDAEKHSLESTSLACDLLAPITFQAFTHSNSHLLVLLHFPRISRWTQLPSDPQRYQIVVTVAQAHQSKTFFLKSSQAYTFPYSSPSPFTQSLLFYHPLTPQEPLLALQRIRTDHFPLPYSFQILQKPLEPVLTTFPECPEPQPESLLPLLEQASISSRPLEKYTAYTFQLPQQPLAHAVIGIELYYEPYRKILPLFPQRCTHFLLQYPPPQAQIALFFFDTQKAQIRRTSYQAFSLK